MIVISTLSTLLYCFLKNCSAPLFLCSWVGKEITKVSFLTNHQSSPEHWHLPFPEREITQRQTKALIKLINYSTFTQTNSLDRWTLADATWPR